MQKKAFRNLFYFVTDLSFVLFILLATVHFWAFNESFYRSEHRKLKLYGTPLAEYIGISDEKLDELTSFTLAYLNDKDATLDLQMEVKGEMREVFTDDEKLHMVDVRTLNLTSVTVMYIAFAVVLLSSIYIQRHKELRAERYHFERKFFRYLFLFFLVLGIWIAIDFNSFWNFFHHIFFAGNELWILDLRKDILIMIVPPEFFFHLVTVILVTFIAILVVYLVISHLFYKRTMKDDQHRIV